MVKRISFWLNFCPYDLSVSYLQLIFAAFGSFLYSTGEETYLSYVAFMAQFSHFYLFNKTLFAS